MAKRIGNIDDCKKRRLARRIPAEDEPDKIGLYAIEAVTVDAAGYAASVIATREPFDPKRGLWWAHTG